MQKMKLDIDFILFTKQLQMAHRSKLKTQNYKISKSTITWVY